jgi:tetratricopeptide (TPR) repeat protein
MQVPATVQAVLAARIDGLSLEEKHLLQAAAVIGTVVPFPLLQAIAGLPEETLGAGLTQLQAAEFLYETRLFPAREYTFAHALTHEVAYGSLSPARRRVLHARLVETLEGLYAEWRAEQVERLAHHAWRGEVWDKALLYCRQAGTKATARSALREAVAYFEQALMALQHLPQSRDTYEQAIDVRLDLRTALMPLGELGRMHGCLVEAEALAQELGDQRRLGQVSAFMSQYFWLTGEPEHAIAAGQCTRDIAVTTGNSALEVQAYLYLGRASHAQGHYLRATDFLGRSAASLEGNLSHERFGHAGLPSVSSHTWLALSFTELGAFAKGIEHGEAGLRVAKKTDQPYNLIQTYHGLGQLYLRNGDLPQAIPLLERALSLCRGAHIPMWFPSVAAPLGCAYAQAGRLAEAFPLLEQAVEQATRIGRMLSLSL